MVARYVQRSVALLALMTLCSGCTMMRPLDQSSSNFITGRCYARTDYETTFLTERGERITAPPNRAHIHDLGQERSLVLWFDKLRKIPLVNIRAFTFNTNVELRTSNGEIFSADSGQ